MAEPSDEAALYGLPLAEFTAARNALAAELRKQGERAAAEAVKGLAKPSITAWALNQVARREPALIDGLLAAGAELGRAQQRLLAGAGQADFREASQAERQAVANLVRAAAAVLAEDGHPASKATLDRLEATARAASTDPEAGRQLQAGRLTADLDPTGFGGLGGGAFGAPAAPIPFPANRRQAKAPPAAEPDPAARLAEARERVRGLQSELRERRTRAAEAEGEAARARQAAVKADRAWADARHAAERAEQAAAKARRGETDAAGELAALRSHVDETGEALEQAEAELRKLQGN